MILLYFFNIVLSDFGYKQQLYEPLNEKHFFNEIKNFNDFQIKQLIRFEDYTKNYIYNDLLNNYKDCDLNKTILFDSFPPYLTSNFMNELEKNILIFLSKYIQKENNVNGYGFYLENDIAKEYRMVFEAIRIKTFEMILNNEINSVDDYKKIKEIKIEKSYYFIGLYTLENKCLNKYLLIEDFREVDSLCDSLNSFVYFKNPTNIIIYTVEKFNKFILPSQIMTFLNDIKQYGRNILE